MLLFWTSSLVTYTVYTGSDRNVIMTVNLKKELKLFITLEGEISFQNVLLSRFREKEGERERLYYSNTQHGSLHLIVP